MWPGCCLRSVHFSCPVEGCGVNWAATEWQAVHTRFPRGTEWTAPGCKCSSDNAAALLLSLSFYFRVSKDGLICPYDLLYDFTASYTYLFLCLYTYICMKISLTQCWKCF